MTTSAGPLTRRCLLASTVAASTFAINAQAAELYVAYFYENSVHKFGSAGEHLGAFISNTGGNYPQSIALDSHGNLYVANKYAYQSPMGDGPASIRKFSSMGGDLGVVVQNEHLSDYSLAIDRFDNLYYVTSRSIRRLGPDGADLGDFFTGIRGSSRGMTFDRDGNLYVVDRGRGIVKISPAGIELGAFPTAAQSPNGLAVDMHGNIFVSDYSNNSIHKLGSNGANLGVFANSGMNHPVGLALDPAGNLYVANNGLGYEPTEFSHSIRKFSPTGEDLGTFVNIGGRAGPEWIAFAPIAVPEPASAWLLVSGGAFIAWRGRRGARHVPLSCYCTPRWGPFLATGTDRPSSISLASLFALLIVRRSVRGPRRHNVVSSSDSK
jgi:DNA-binding beta-propeller fold protein YncE